MEWNNNSKTASDLIRELRAKGPRKRSRSYDQEEERQINEIKQSALEEFRKRIREKGYYCYSDINQVGSVTRVDNHQFHTKESRDTGVRSYYIGAAQDGTERVQLSCNMPCYFFKVYEKYSRLTDEYEFLNHNCPRPRPT